MSRCPTLVAVVEMRVDPDFGIKFEEEIVEDDETGISISWESIPSEMTGVESEEGVLYFYKVLVNDWGKVDANFVQKELEKVAEFALNTCPTVSINDAVFLSLAYW